MDTKRAREYLDLAGLATPGPWRKWNNPMRADGAFVAYGPPRFYEGRSLDEFARGIEVGRREAPPSTLHYDQMKHPDVAFIAASRTEGPYFAERYLEARAILEIVAKCSCCNYPDCPKLERPLTHWCDACRARKFLEGA